MGTICCWFGIEQAPINRVTTFQQFTEKYKDFRATLEYVTNKSEKGTQFVKGFGGVGGLLWYELDPGNSGSYC